MLAELLFAALALTLLVGIPYYILTEDSSEGIVRVAGYNSPDWDPGIWFISYGGWSFRGGSKINEIVVEQGEVVTLYLTSMDVVHGFYLPGYGINETLYPGRVKTVKFVANESGEFPFKCNVRSCGFGHLAMNGTLIVKPR